MDSDLDSFVNFESIDGGKDDSRPSAFLGSFSPETAATAAAAAAAVSAFFSSTSPNSNTTNIPAAFMQTQWAPNFPSLPLHQSSDQLNLPTTWASNSVDASPYRVAESTIWESQSQLPTHPSISNTDTARSPGIPTAPSSSSESNAVPRGLIPSSVPSPHRPVASSSFRNPLGDPLAKASPSTSHSHRQAIHVDTSNPDLFASALGFGAQQYPGRCQVENVESDDEAQWKMFLSTSLSNPQVTNDTSPDSIGANVSTAINTAIPTSGLGLYTPASTSFPPSSSNVVGSMDFMHDFRNHNESTMLNQTSPRSSSVAQFPQFQAVPVYLDNGLHPSTSAQFQQNQTQPVPISSPHHHHHQSFSNVPYLQDSPFASPDNQTIQRQSTSLPTTPPSHLSFPSSAFSSAPLNPASPSSTHFSFPPAPNFASGSNSNIYPASLPVDPTLNAGPPQPTRRRGLVGWMPSQPQQISPPLAATRTATGLDGIGTTKYTPPRRPKMLAPTLSVPRPASRTAITANQSTSPTSGPSRPVIGPPQGANHVIRLDTAPVQPHFPPPVTATGRVSLGGFPLRKYDVGGDLSSSRPSPSHSRSSSAVTFDSTLSDHSQSRGNKRRRSNSISDTDFSTGTDRSRLPPQSAAFIPQGSTFGDGLPPRKSQRKPKSRRLNLGPESDSDFDGRGGPVESDGDDDDDEYRGDGDEEDSDDYFPSRSPSPPHSSHSRKPSFASSSKSRSTRSPSLSRSAAGYSQSFLPPSAMTQGGSSSGGFDRFGYATTSMVDRHTSSSSTGTQGSGSRRTKGKARGSAALALAVVTQLSMQSGSGSASRPDSRLDGTSDHQGSRSGASNSPSSPIFDPRSIDLETHPGIRKRKNHPIPLPVPVPNLNKKSRGRKVPFVLKVDPQTGAVELPEGAVPATDNADLDYEPDNENPVIPGPSSGGGSSRRRRPSSTGSRRKSVTPAPLLSGGEGERTYVCVIPGCGKCFVRGEHLKRHVRSIHTHDKPHVCPYEGCDKTFSRRDNLGQHVRIHLQQQ